MSDKPLDILVVSQMYPGCEAPDLGVFVQGQEQELLRRGHRVRVTAVTRRGGGIKKHLGFAFRVLFDVWRFKPQVVYAHFLAPAGVLAAVACLFRRRTGLVVIAHGRDVRNIGTKFGVSLAMKLLVWRADEVIAVSKFLADDLEKRVPKLRGRVQVIDSGVDIKERFIPAVKKVCSDSTDVKFLFVGTLDERKNVLRLAEAFERLSEGELVFVGDGPLRSELEQRERVKLVGRVAHDEVVAWMQQSDVLCLPSLVEPFGQVLIEAMGCECSVVATCVGGPPEFVDAQSGVLVNPESVDDIERGLRAVIAFERPNQHAREQALKHDISAQVERVEVLLKRAAVARRSLAR